MSRTVKGSKGPGWEYWSRRPCNRGGLAPTKRKCSKSAASAKQWSNRVERRTAEIPDDAQ